MYDISMNIIKEMKRKLHLLDIVKKSCFEYFRVSMPKTCQSLI